MNIRGQLVCAWGAIGFAIMGLLGFVVANIIPPMSPDLSAVEIAAIFQENTLSMRFGFLLFMTSTGFMSIFVAAVAMQMKRIEGGIGPYTVAQIAAGSVTALIFIVATAAWTAAAFRPDGNPEVIRSLNDLGWIMLLMTFAPFIMQNFSLGFCILSDSGETKVMPRWVGFYNLWTGVTFIPGGMLTFFKTGPFAWDGLFVWWIPFTFFFGWFPVMFFVIRKAILEQEAAGES
ncbi:MAG: hypothetical protein VCB59_09465 [Gammaproteobacteria bacterium]